jgi:hypothetical protein
MVRTRRKALRAAALAGAVGLAGAAALAPAPPALAGVSGSGPVSEAGPLFGIASASGYGFGRCTDTFVDLTCPGHGLTTTGRISYVGYLAAVSPVQINYMVPGVADAVHQARVAVGASGEIDGSTDVRSFASPGDRLRIRVEWSGGGVVETRATAIEYGLIVAG